MKKRNFSIFLVLSLLITLSISSIHADDNTSITQLTGFGNASIEPVKGLQISPEIQDFSKKVFGIKDAKPLTASSLIIHICLLLFVILIAQTALSTSNMEKLLTWFIAIIISLIGSIGGGIEMIYKFYTSLAYFKNFGAFTLFFSIIVLMVLMVLFKYFINKLKSQNHAEDNMASGMQVGFWSKIKKNFSS